MRDKYKPNKIMFLFQIISIFSFFGSIYKYLNGILFAVMMPYKMPCIRIFEAILGTA